MRKEKIRLDYNNMLSQRIGDKGITPEEFAAVSYTHLIRSTSRSPMSTWGISSAI